MALDEYRWNYGRDWGPLISGSPLSLLSRVSRAYACAAMLVADITHPCASYIGIACECHSGRFRPHPAPILWKLVVYNVPPSDCSRQLLVMLVTGLLVSDLLPRAQGPFSRLSGARQPGMIQATCATVHGRTVSHGMAWHGMRHGTAETGGDTGRRFARRSESAKAALI